MERFGVAVAEAFEVGFAEEFHLRLFGGLWVVSREYDEWPGVVFDDAQYAHVAPTCDRVMTAVIDDALCGLGADARHAQQRVHVGCVDVDREHAQVVHRYRDFRRDHEIEVAIAGERVLELARRELIDALEPVQLVEHARAPHGRFGVLLHRRVLRLEEGHVVRALQVQVVV